MPTTQRVRGDVEPGGVTEVKALLGLPDDVSTWALMPIGWPIDNFGLKATQIVFAMLREFESQDDGSADPAVFTEADHEIIRRIQARLRNETG